MVKKGFATYFANVGVDLARQDWDTQWQMVGANGFILIQSYRFIVTVVWKFGDL